MCNAEFIDNVRRHIADLKRSSAHTTQLSEIIIRALIDPQTLPIEKATLLEMRRRLLLLGREENTTPPGVGTF